MKSSINTSSEFRLAHAHFDLLTTLSKSLHMETIVWTAASVTIKKETF